jgi:Flp pilus assembly protein TadD
MSGQLHMLAATEYADRGMYREADEVMRDATERFPDSWHVWMRWGAILTEQGRFDEAETYLLRAFHINPNPMVMLYGLRLEAKKEAAHAATTQAATRATTQAVTLPPNAHGSAVGFRGGVSAAIYVLVTSSLRR